MKRPIGLLFLIFIQVLLAFNAIYGGGSLIIAPDGTLLGLKKEWISGTPFPDFLIPGVLLFLFMGIFPIITLVGLFRKNTSKLFDGLNLYPDKYWGWTFSLYSGITCITWIVVQQLLTDYFILQPIICGTGLLIVILTLLPRVQKYYTKMEG